MYHLPRVFRTLVPEIRVRPEMLRVFRYIDLLTCMIYNCIHSTEQQGQLELLMSAVGECTDTWYKHISLLRQ